MKRFLMILTCIAVLLSLAGCAGVNVSDFVETNYSDSHETEAKEPVSEEGMEDDTESEVTFTDSEISEFCDLMDACFGVGPGSAGSSLRSVSAAGSLLDWAENHSDMLTEETLEELLAEWNGYDWDYEDLEESWNSVVGSIEEIVADPTDESLLGLLDDSGYTLQHESYSEDLAELLITTIGNHYEIEKE
ncbi:MAG: hypothetical protein LUH03_03665 [Oscillospiraceae bacterium]|nr:hypothetical protein [Oscillospiraceae bacterium]